MKIIEIDALWKASFNQFQHDGLKNDEEAIKWAEALGAEEVYKYQTDNWLRYIVKAEHEEQD